MKAWGWHYIRQNNWTFKLYNWHQNHYFVSFLDAPDIVAPTLDSARRIVANKSDTVTLRCQFDGNPAPAISWYYHEQEIARGDASLVLERVRQGDGGEYKCKAESVLGAAENVLTLVVRGAPIITSEPGT